MSLHDYAGILFHSGRIGAFRRAIDALVLPGSSVLEVGSGLGTYALFAARAGARRVVALDRSPVVHLAETLAARNGLSDRLTVLRGNAPESIPREAFDLAIFEDFPPRLFDGPTHALLTALGAGHLAEGGRLLPGSARLSLAPVRDPRFAIRVPLDPTAPEAHGLDWTELRHALANTGRQVFLPPTALPGAPVRGVVHTLLPPPHPDVLGLQGAWEPGPGPIHGLAVWFDLDLGPGGWVSSEPRPDPEPWGQWLLPLDPPLEVAPGAVLRGRVWWEPGPGGGPGFMGWRAWTSAQERLGHEFGGIPFSGRDLGPPENSGPEPG